MNKTVNINLGGVFFHIDEDAFQKLSHYFEAIKHSLSNSSGQEEIIKDIEMRIAELITEKQRSDKQVVSLIEVEEVMAIMGQPEDYRIDGEAEESPTPFKSIRKPKKLYRDTDHKVIGGVAAGLGHYFGVDAIWFKAMFLIFVIAGFGTGIIAYLILWLVIPEAVTTSEKIEMKGEPVTISNIEKKVREEFETMSERFRNSDGSVGSQIHSMATSLSLILTNILQVFAKIVGFFIIAISSLALFGITIAMLVVAFTSSAKLMPWQNKINALIYNDLPLWSIALLGFLALAIPLFFFLILGLKIVSNRLKLLGNIARFTLLGVWISAVVALIYFGLNQAYELAYEGKVVEKIGLTLKAQDTLFVKFKNNDYYSKEVSDQEDFVFTQDSANTNLIYSNKVRFRIMKTDQKTPYLEIEKLANGKSLFEAKKRANKIKYAFEIVGNQIILDNYLLTALENKYRCQEVEVYLYLPEGVLFSPNQNIRFYDESDYHLQLNSANELYKMTGNVLTCLNCLAKEDSDGKLKTTTTIKVNGDEVITTEVEETKWEYKGK